MAKEQESFETLVNEAPLAPTAGTVSLVGALARSAEAGKFVLTLEDGRAVVLETAAVKGYVVLGTSVGQTIVRIDVNAEQVRSEAEVSTSTYGFGAQVQAGAFTPFALATAQQLPAATLAALQSPYKSPLLDFHKIAPADFPGTLPLFDPPHTIGVFDYPHSVPRAEFTGSFPYPD
jgi:hypothetical protein